MEGVVERNLREMIRSKAPHLYDNLSQNGELDHFIYYKAAAISSEVSHQRYREQWDYLPHLELVHRLNVARSAATAAVMGDLLAQELDHSDAERALAV